MDQILVINAKENDLKLFSEVSEKQNWFLLFYLQLALLSVHNSQLWLSKNAFKRKYVLASPYESIILTKYLLHKACRKFLRVIVGIHPDVLYISTSTKHAIKFSTCFYRCKVNYFLPYCMKFLNHLFSPFVHLFSIFFPSLFPRKNIQIEMEKNIK